jgi:hypothetical protein
MREDPAPDAPAEDGRIAIVGIAGRFARAPDVDQFWAAYRDGALLTAECYGMFASGLHALAGLPARTRPAHSALAFMRAAR